MSGRVQVDETYLGVLEEGVRGRQTFKKAMIAVAAEENGEVNGRILMLRVADASAISLRPLIVQAIEPGSTIITDGWEGYSGLEAYGYVHKLRAVGGSRKSTNNLLPLVHRVVSLLKRWILGTHQGAVSPEHIDYYLDEFTFRFNRRSSQHRGKLFYRLLQHAMLVEPTTYGRIIKHVRGPRPRLHKI